MKEVAIDGDKLFLSEEIIINILKRLPVKSLFRFRCVCKDWENLIKTPSFIAAHLQNSSNQNPILVSARFDGDLMLFDLLHGNIQGLELRNAPVIRYDQDRFVGSCNGLLCFSIGHFDRSPPSFTLWNPATGEVRHVPKPLTEFRGHFFIGFGFSSIVNDYKIVVNYVTQFYYEVKRVDVYSLSKGSWKELEFGKLEGVSLRRETANANGVIFWRGSKQVVLELGGLMVSKGDGGLIVSFDIATEVFTVIPMPELALISIPLLTVYENKPAFLVCTTSENTEYSYVDLWVMEEDVDANSETWNWMKKYTGDTRPCLSYPATIWRNEVVCYAYVKPELTMLVYLLNLTTNKGKMLPLGFEDAEVFNYVESLVPVSNNHIEEV